MADREIKRFLSVILARFETFEVFRHLAFFSGNMHIFVFVLLNFYICIFECT